MTVTVVINLEEERMKDKNPNDNLLILFLFLGIILFGMIAVSNLWMKHKLDKTYTTKPTMETRGMHEDYVPSKQRFKITFEPLEE